MRWRHYIIVIAIYVFFWLVGMTVGAIHSKRVRDLVNYAGRNNLPILITQGANEHRDPGFVLHAPGLNPVTFMTGRDYYNGCTFGFFDETGTFHTFVDVYDMELNRSRKTLKSATLHDKYFITDPIGEMIRENVHASIYDVTDVRSWWHLKVLGPYWNFGDVRFVNFYTGETEDIRLADLLTADVSNNYCPSTSWLAKISGNGKVGLITTYCIEGGTDSEFWLLDFDTRKLTSLGIFNVAAKTDFIINAHSYISFDGSVIAYEEPVNVPPGDGVGSTSPPSGSTSTGSMIFIDGETGEDLHTESSVTYVTIGKRWAGIIKPTPGSGELSSLLVLDMENNWESTLVATGEFGHFAMYEPPPNGLEGMGENFNPGD